MTSRATTSSSTPLAGRSRYLTSGPPKGCLVFTIRPSRSRVRREKERERERERERGEEREREREEREREREIWLYSCSVLPVAKEVNSY